MQKSLLLTIMLSILFGQFLSAQINATTKEGKEVLLNEDGTWKYIEKREVSSDELNLECSELISTETDKMTGRSTTAAKETLIISEDGGKTGFGIYALNGSRYTILSIQAAGAGSCIDDDDTINILFRDGSRLELTNNGKFNCDAKMTLFFGGTFGNKKDLKELSTKEIETMRVWTSKSYVEKDFSSDQSNKLMQTLKCLSEK
ncbi:hypothetical protein [Marixanthomonas spongiae]|uniref:DUF3157 family protein n=1 Tax=Marixanthomonas spongiae TaxID=2174845 RepID=A0A2U0HZG9_9FLAO|nr:hypothetical protein [Marixanthomonas spongiae]PVW14228.1 hypothetical protein DDV96_10500 [Marixanthomonas spongiae]